MWILWVGVLLCGSSYTMSIPFLPLFLVDLGVGEQSVHLWAGVVHSSAFFVGAIMSPLWGAIADRYGKRKMVIRAGFSLAVTYALFAVVRSPWELVAARLVHGFAGGFIPAAMSIVASVSPKERMSWSLGVMQSATMTGGILGPLFGGALAEWFGFRMSFVVAAAVIFLAALAVVAWVKEDSASPAEAPAKPVRLMTALSNKPLLFLLMLLVVFQASYNMIQPLMTLHIADLQGGMEDAALSSGIVFALIGIAGIVGSPLWGNVGAKRGLLRTLILCLLAAGGFMSLQLFVQQLWLFAAVQFAFGLFMAGVVPMVNTLVVQNTPDVFRGRSLGLTASANQLGSMIGPLIGGFVGMALNVHWTFFLAGLMMLALGGAVWNRSAWLSRGSAKERASGRSVPG